jgi:hypothetical protein
MPVTGTLGRSLASRVQHAVRAERTISRVLHRYFDDATQAGALAVIQCEHDRREQVMPAKKRARRRISPAGHPESRSN